MSNRRRMQVYRTTHLLHWISAAVCLAGLLLFSITGITLNHASSISANPAVIKRSALVPEALRGSLAGEHAATDTVPAPLGDWIAAEFGVDAASANVEWSDEELYLSAPGPGRDAWVSIERADGAARFESTDRGWIAYFNDLHKGRNTGVVWIIFIDVIAAACLFFSLTGLVLLQIQARQRPSTWPLVLGGVGLIAAVMIFFVH